MTRLPKWSWAACIFLLSLPVFAQIDESVHPQAASLEVVVIDQDGRPIPGAEVRWTIAAPTFRRLDPSFSQADGMRTDLNGECSINTFYVGPLRIAVRREGYLDADDLSQLEHVEVVQVDRGRPVKLFVDLVRGASFQGTVYLEDGSRVQGAVVRLQPAAISWNGPIRGAAPEWLTARTDVQGNFVFPVVPPAQYGMWIAPPARVVTESLVQNDRGEWTGYGTVVWHTSVEELRRIIPVDIGPGEDVRGYNVVLRKARVYPIQGTLREWSGAPLVHAKVAVRAAGENPVALLEPRPVDARTGDFDFSALPEGAYSLLVYRDDAPDAPPYAIPFVAGEGADQYPALGPIRLSRHVVRIPPWTPVVGTVEVLEPVHAQLPDSQPAAATLAPSAAVHAHHAEPAPVVARLTPVDNDHVVSSDAVRLETATGNFRVVELPPGTYEFTVEVPEPWYVVSARGANADLLKNPIFPVSPRRNEVAERFVIEVRRGGAALEGTVVDDRYQPLPGGAMCATAEDRKSVV